MKYGEAKKDFVIFAVFAYVETKNGKTKLREVDPEKENIEDDAEGRVGAYDYLGGLASAPRLCFILKEKRNEIH